MLTSTVVRAVCCDAQRGLMALSLTFVLGGAVGCASTSASKSGDFGGSSVQTAVIQNAQGAARGINMVSTTEVNSVLINAPVEKA